MSQRLLAAVLMAATQLFPWRPAAATHPLAVAAGSRLTISASVDLPDPCHEATILPRAGRDSYEVMIRLRPQDVHAMCAMVITASVARNTFNVRSIPRTIRLQAADQAFVVRVRRAP
jgi:hypothetical protein